MTYEAKLIGRLGMRGAFECRNAAGDVVKTIEFSGTLPLEAVQDQSEQQERPIGDHDQ